MVCTILAETHKVRPIRTRNFFDDMVSRVTAKADTIAASLAQSLSQSFEVSLWYCFEKQGVLENIDDDGSVIETITPQKYKNLKTAQVIHSGMIPKIDNCFDALANGVNEVKIGAPKMIAGISQHTTITLKDE